MNLPAELAGLILFVFAILKFALYTGLAFVPVLWWIAERRYR